MKEYKKQFYRRKELERDKWRNVLEKERELEVQKAKMLEKYKERERKKIEVSKRLQAYNIAAGFLRNLEENTLEQLINDGFYQNEFENQLKSDFLDWLVDETQAESAKIESIYENTEKLFGERVPKLVKKKDKIIKQRDAVRLKKERRRQNFSQSHRVLRVFYKDEITVASYFVNNFLRFIDGGLNDYEQNYEARSQALQGSYKL
jgi:hypothetical protein